MRLNKGKRPDSIALDMTPMTDVTFQLIIFFMTTGSAAMVENEKMELPMLKGTTDQGEYNLVINITAENKIINRGNSLTVPQLKGLVNQVIKEGGGKTDLMLVVVRVDRRCTSALVNQVMVMLQQAGIKKGRIAVEVPD